MDLYTRAGGPMVDAGLILLRGLSPHAGDDFLKVMRAAECFHNKTIGGQRLARAKWQALRRRMRTVAEDDAELGLIEAVIGFANNLSLGDRFSALVERCSPNVRRIAEANQQTIKDAVKLRNDFSHGGEVVPGRFMQMGAATALINAVLQSVLLCEVGLSGDEVDTLMRGSYDWGYMDHLDPMTDLAWGPLKKTKATDRGEKSTTGHPWSARRPTGCAPGRLASLPNHGEGGRLWLGERRGVTDNHARGRRGANDAANTVC